MAKRQAAELARQDVTSASRPGVVKQKPARAGLILFRLERRLSFRCIRCDRSETSDVVALEKANDWNRVVCESCYSRAIQTERTEARKARKTTQPPQQSKKKKKQKKQKGDALTRHAPRVATFFHEADVPIEFDNGWVKIEGERAFDTRRMKLASVLDWNNLINRLVLAHCADRFIEALRRNGPAMGEHVKAFYSRESHTFTLRRNEETLGSVEATRVRISGEYPTTGNFLIDGPHWKEVAQTIQRRDRRFSENAPSRSTEDDATSRRWRVINEPPPALSSEIVDACLRASADIRLRRSMAYTHPVVLQSQHGLLRLLPITQTGGALDAPFELRREDRVVKGSIRLAGASDPLTVRVSGDVPDDMAVIAWAAALLGFAALTCFEIRPQPPRQQGGLTSRDRGTRTRSFARTETSPRSVPRRRFWPSNLEPIGRWAQRGASFVPGHRRRLNDGRTASAEARERARRVGINLGSRETWVQPHTRGLAASEELTFRWHEPAALGEALKLSR